MHPDGRTATIKLLEEGLRHLQYQTDTNRLRLDRVVPPPPSAQQPTPAAAAADLDGSVLLQAIRSPVGMKAIYSVLLGA